MDTLLLSTARIATFDIDKPLTNASGFSFERDGRLYLVTSRHVVIDAPSKQHPNRITIDIHTDAGDLGRSVGFGRVALVWPRVAECQLHARSS